MSANLQQRYAFSIIILTLLLSICFTLFQSKMNCYFLFNNRFIITYIIIYISLIQSENISTSKSFILIIIIFILLIIIFRSLAVGSKAGYKLFSLNSVDHLEKIYENGNKNIYTFTDKY